MISFEFFDENLFYQQLILQYIYFFLKELLNKI